MIAGAILAAGEGRRIGTPKALLATGAGTETFVQRAVRTLESAGVTRVAVVVSPGIAGGVQRLLPGATVCVNTDPARGQLSSLHVAIDALASDTMDALIVLPVDVPLVTAETVSRLIEVWSRTRPAIVRPTRGTVHGHPVMFDARVLPELRAADPAIGARPIVRKYATAQGDVPIDDAGPFVDIDSAEDYRRAFGIQLPPGE